MTGTPQGEMQRAALGKPPAILHPIGICRPCQGDRQELFPICQHLDPSIVSGERGDVQCIRQGFRVQQLIREIQADDRKKEQPRQFVAC